MEKIGRYLDSGCIIYLLIVVRYTCFNVLLYVPCHRMKQTAAFIFLILWSTCTLFAQNNVKVGSVAPQFSSAALDGSPVSLGDLKGSVVVVTFWSTKCEICRHEIPRLNRFIERYDQKKVSFLAFTMESEEKVTPYLLSNPFKFQILPNSFGVLYQYADRDRAGYIDMGFPTFFVIDQQGIVQLKASGYDKTDLINNAISRLISK